MNEQKNAFKSKATVGILTVNLVKEGLSGLNKWKEAWYDLTSKHSQQDSAGSIKLRLKLDRGQPAVRRLPSSKLSLERLPSPVKASPKQPQFSAGGKIRGVPPIVSIVREKDDQALQEFLDTASPEDINATVTKTGNTALHEACIDRSEKILQLLLSVCFVCSFDHRVPQTHLFCLE